MNGLLVVLNLMGKYVADMEQHVIQLQEENGKLKEQIAALTKAEA